MRTLIIALLLTLLATAPAEARVRVSRVSASPTATGVTVRFTVTHRGKARVTITLRGAKTAHVRRTITVHRKRRLRLRARVGSGSWKVTVCARAGGRSSCARAVRVTVTAPAPWLGESRNLHVDAAHTGALDVPSPAPPLRERWRTDDAPGMALVVGDRVFTAGERGVTARDDRTGAIVWRREDVGAHGIAYDIGRVFAVGDGITALNATSGATLWQAASGPFISPPVADGGELFVSVKQTIVRFDEETGAVVWSRPSQSSANRAPTLDATRVWPGNSCAPLLRASGDPAGPALDPCPNDGDSFVAPESAGHILLRDFQRSGTWFDYDTGRSAYTGVSFGGLPPAISGTTMVVAGATVTGYTFPAMTPRWSYTVPAPDSLCCLPPLIVGRHVYFADNDYHFYALNLDSGALEWKVLGPYFWEYDTGAGPRSMAAGDGLLLVPTTGYMIAYE